IYDLQVVASTGQGTIEAIDPDLSINDQGRVAFIATQQGSAPQTAGMKVQVIRDVPVEADDPTLVTQPAVEAPLLGTPPPEGLFTNMRDGFAYGRGFSTLGMQGVGLSNSSTFPGLFGSPEQAARLGVSASTELYTLYEGLAPNASGDGLQH